MTGPGAFTAKRFAARVPERSRLYIGPVVANCTKNGLYVGGLDKGRGALEKAGCAKRSLTSRAVFVIIGEVPEWPKGADCKSAGNAFGGSNPPLTTNYNIWGGDSLQSSRAHTALKAK
jgi:hypothetical protein